MFCEECGNKMPENAKFCPKCGTSCSDDGNMPETNGGTKVGKKPKKHRKKSKAVIALCTAVAVVGVSVGGFALYKNYGKPSVIQKANDLDVAWYIIDNMENDIYGDYREKHPDEEFIDVCKNCKFNYSTADKSVNLKKYFKDNASSITPDIEERFSSIKNEYTLYTSAGGGDIYSGLIFEQDGLIGEIDNLTDKDYSWMFLDSYRIKNGKIYGEQNIYRSGEKEDVYKIEGELLDQDILIEEKLRETEKNKKQWTNYLNENYEKPISVDEVLKEYEKYLNKWKTATKVEDEDGKSELIMYRIKDYKDGVLLVEDCYRPVPQFLSFLDEKYMSSN